MSNTDIGVMVYQRAKYDGVVDVTATLGMIKHLNEKRD